MEEVFKKLEINDKEFLISNLGRIFRDGNEVTPNVNHDGYLFVYIGNNRNMTVHRLVAKAFIHNDDPEVKKEVNHKDFDRQNNRVENLEWLSHADNVRYSADNGRYVGKFGKDNPNFGNRKLSKYYAENPDIALEKQSRKGTQNGRSKPVELFKDGVFIAKFDYIGDCCEYLHKYHGFSDNAETVRIGIRRSIKRNVPYKGFTFIK